MDAERRLRHKLGEPTEYYANAHSEMNPQEAKVLELVDFTREISPWIVYLHEHEPI